MQGDYDVYKSSVEIFNSPSIFLALKPCVERDVAKILKKQIYMSASCQERLDRAVGVKTQQCRNRHRELSEKLCICHLPLVIRIVFWALHEDCCFASAPYSVVFPV